MRVFHYFRSSTNRGKWLTSFMLCAMSTCLMIMLLVVQVVVVVVVGLFSISISIYLPLRVNRMFCVIVFYWVFAVRLFASYHERKRALFSLLPAIMFILRLLEHKLQWPPGTNERKKRSNSKVHIRWTPSYLAFFCVFSISFARNVVSYV